MTRPLLYRLRKRLYSDEAWQRYLTKLARNNQLSTTPQPGLSRRQILPGLAVTPIVVKNLLGERVQETHLEESKAKTVPLSSMSAVGVTGGSGWMPSYEDWRNEWRNEWREGRGYL